MNERKRGYRCKVCTFCGRCFEDETPAQESAPVWRGQRCEVCVECGKRALAWGVGSSNDVDAVSHATNWADAFKVMDDGSAGAPPAIPGAPGLRGAETSADDTDECDAVTGATPGVATACRELGLDDMANLAGKLGIKPPGQA